MAIAGRLRGIEQRFAVERACVAARWIAEEYVEDFHVRRAREEPLPGARHLWRIHRRVARELHVTVPALEQGSDYAADCAASGNFPDREGLYRRLAALPPHHQRWHAG